MLQVILYMNKPQADDSIAEEQTGSEPEATHKKIFDLRLLAE